MEQPANNAESWTQLLEEILKNIPEEERPDIHRAANANLEAIREAMQHMSLDLGTKQAGDLVAQYLKSLMPKG